MKTETTIAILSHNRSWHLAQCIASIREFSYAPYIIKILDVDSTPVHREHVKQFAGPDCLIYPADDFPSCLEGRRRFLDMVDTEFVIYLDDDIRVGPRWIENMLRPIRLDTNSGASVANIVQEGEKVMSGVRYLEQSGRTLSVKQHEVGYLGQAPLSCGGATLYKLDTLKATEYRPEFSGGYEDWDQTMQITQDLGRGIYGTQATLFHKHMPECKDYFSDRWRWRELMESALGMYDRWNIRTGVDKVLAHFVKNEIVIPKDQAARVMEVIT